MWGILKPGLFILRPCGSLISLIMLFVVAAEFTRIVSRQWGKYLCHYNESFLFLNNFVNYIDFFLTNIKGSFV